MPIKPSDIQFKASDFRSSGESPPPDATRLNQLADFLCTLPPEKFGYADFVQKRGGEWIEAPAVKPDPRVECGTTCCAAGWLPAIEPDHFAWIVDVDDDKVRMHCINPASVTYLGLDWWFNMSHELADAVFFEAETLFGDWGGARPKKDSLRIEHLVFILRLLAFSGARTPEELELAYSHLHPSYTKDCLRNQLS